MKMRYATLLLKKKSKIFFLIKYLFFVYIVDAGRCIECPL